MGERAQLTTKTPETKKKTSVSHSRKPVFNHVQNSPVDRVLHLQQTIGNQAVQRLFQSGIMQGKFKISPTLTEMRRGSESIIARKEKSKPVTKPKGGISYKKHESFVKKGLSADTVTAAAYITGTKVGNDVIKWLESHGIIVTVFLVAESKDIPDLGSETAAGYFEEVGPKSYHVYVVAGYKSGDFVRTKSGSLEWKAKIVNLDMESISDTLFHELLHVWFVNRFPEALIETGHTEKVEPEVKAFGVKTYDEEEYDPEFLKKLKEFDVQLKKLIEARKKAKEK